MKTLLIIDLQNDFIKGGSLEVPEGHLIIDGINQILDNYDLIIATQDSHPKGHKSFATTHKKNIGDIIQLGGQSQILWPEHCIKNTVGEELCKNLNKNKINYIVKKGENIEVDSYSGFLDNDKKTFTQLHSLLQKHNVTEFDIVGLALDYCVKFTCIDGIHLNYKINLLSNLTKAVNINPDDGQNTIKELKNIGVIIR